MGGLFGKGQRPDACLWGLWCAGIAMLLVVSMPYVRSLYGQTPATRQGPPYQTSPTSPPAARPVSGTERIVELSLEDAIRLAVQHNLEIERERFSPQIARTEVERQRAAFDPVVGVDAQVSETKSLPVNRTLQFDSTGAIIGERVLRQFTSRDEITPRFRHKVLLGGNYELRFLNFREDIAPSRIGTSSRIADPRFESRLELTFTQPLLRDFGIAVNTAAIRQAEKAALIAEQQLLQAILDTVFIVQQRYWTLVFRLQDLDVKRESLRLAEEFLAENKVRVELGTLAPIELVQAETRVKTREGDVIRAEAAVGDAEDLLKEVLNMPETLGTWQIRLRPTDSPPFVPITAIPVEEKVALALQKRPDFLRSQLDIASREIARDFARNQRRPRLDIIGRSSVAAFGEGFDESTGRLGDAEGYEWLIGLRFEQPLGNRLARNEFLRRDLELRQALVDQRQLILTIVREIRQAIREIETQSKQVEVTRQATVLARTQLEAEQEKFRLGLSTSFNVLEFQEDLSIARTNETLALNDYNVVLARLDQLTGRLQYADVATYTK